MNKWTTLTSEEMQIKTTLNLYPTQIRKAPRTGEDVGKEEPVLAGMETVTPTPTGHMSQNGGWVPQDPALPTL